MVAVVVFEFGVMRCQPLRRALYSFINFGVYIQLSLANGSQIVHLSQGVARIMLSKRLRAMSVPFVRFSYIKAIFVAGRFESTVAGLFVCQSS